MRDLDLVAVGSEVLIDEELVQIDAVDPIAGTLILTRGCVDTVPAPHAEGARIWCTESYVGADPTEHLAGESIEAKLLTRTQQGTLSAEPAADQRQRRAAAEFCAPVDRVGAPRPRAAGRPPDRARGRRHRA